MWRTRCKVPRRSRTCITIAIASTTKIICVAGQTAQAKKSEALRLEGAASSFLTSRLSSTGDLSAHDSASGSPTLSTNDHAAFCLVFGTHSGLFSCSVSHCSKAAGTGGPINPQHHILSQDGSCIVNVKDGSGKSATAKGSTGYLVELMILQDVLLGNSICEEGLITGRL